MTVCRKTTMRSHTRAPPPPTARLGSSGDPPSPDLASSRCFGQTCLGLAVSTQGLAGASQKAMAAPAPLSPRSMVNRATADQRLSLLRGVLTDEGIDGWEAALAANGLGNVKALITHGGGKPAEAAADGENDRTTGGKKIVTMLNLIRRGHSADVPASTDGGFEKLSKLLIACIAVETEYDDIAKEARAAQRAAAFAVSLGTPPSGAAAGAAITTGSGSVPSAGPIKVTPDAIDDLLATHGIENKIGFSHDGRPASKAVNTCNEGAKHDPPKMPDFNAVKWETENGDVFVRRDKRGRETDGMASAEDYLGEGACLVDTLVLSFSFRSDDGCYGHLTFKELDRLGTSSTAAGTSVYVGSKERLVRRQYDRLRAACRLGRFKSAACSRAVRKFYRVRPPSRRTARPPREPRAHTRAPSRSRARCPPPPASGDQHPPAQPQVHADPGLSERGGGEPARPPLGTQGPPRRARAPPCQRREEEEEEQALVARPLGQPVIQFRPVRVQRRRVERGRAAPQAHPIGRPRQEKEGEGPRQGGNRS